MKPTQDFAGLSTAVLQANAERIAGQLEELQAQMAQLSATRQQLVADQQAVADEQARQKLASQKGIDWAWVLAQDPENSEVRYRESLRAIREFAKWQTHSGLSAESYNVHTNQRVPKIALLRGVPDLTLQVCRALEAMLPFMTPCAPTRREAELVKYVSVFEASLSEYGSYYLAIDESAGLFELRKTRYGLNVVHKAGSLLELLTFVENNCYYDDWTQRAAVHA